MPRWIQCSSRFDKNPAKYEAGISLHRERVTYGFTLCIFRKDSRWFMHFDPFFTEQFPEELGEMSGEEAKLAAKTLCEEAVLPQVTELEGLVLTDGAVFPRNETGTVWRRIEHNKSESYFRVDLEEGGFCIHAYLSHSDSNWAIIGPFDEPGEPGELGIFPSERDALREAAARTLRDFTEILQGLRS
jgi:hypothetical protein